MITKGKTQTLTFSHVNTDFWESITYTDLTGSKVTDSLEEQSYQVVKDTTVKLNGKDGIPRDLYTLNDEGNCTNGIGNKGSSTGCQFTMPSIPLSLDLNKHFCHFCVFVVSGSVAIEVL